MPVASARPDQNPKGPDGKRPQERRVPGEGVLRAPKGVGLMRCIRTAGAPFWHIRQRVRVGNLTNVQMAQAMGVAVWRHAVELKPEDIAYHMPRPRSPKGSKPARPRSPQQGSKPARVRSPQVAKKLIFR